MIEEIKTSKNKKIYNINSIIVKKNKIQRKKDYFEETINALIKYMEKNELNPNEKQWNNYAINRKYLSSKTIGYLSGIGFNTLCRKIRKQINKNKRQMK